MTNDTLPTVTPAERGAPAFASTLNDTTPLPLPLAFPVTTIQGAVLVAVHEHPG
jgi:hypothetical protein